MLLSILGAICFGIMGFSLGMLGSGGGILAVPILVYFFHLDPILATSYSLGIVGMTSAIGGYRKAKKKEWDLKKAWPLGLSSTVGLIIARSYLLPATPSIISFEIGLFSFQAEKSQLILFLFAVFLILVGRKMLRSVLPPINKKVPLTSSLENLPLALLSLLGFAIGLLAGFMGAGGGFFFIPLLTLGMGLSMHKAVGTSLVIISFNSLVGFAIDLLGKMWPLDLQLFFGLLIFALAGLVIGIFYSSKIDERKL